MGMMKEDDNGSKSTILKTVMSNKVLKGQSSTLIDKADLKNLTKQEHYCIHVLKRETSLGKNIEDGLQVLIILPCFTDYLMDVVQLNKDSLLFVLLLLFGCFSCVIWFCLVLFILSLYRFSLAHLFGILILFYIGLSNACDFSILGSFSIDTICLSNINFFFQFFPWYHYNDGFLLNIPIK